MMTSSNLILGYDFDKWYGYETKQPIETDISTKTNSHMILCGMSGSGKSYATNLLFAKIASVGEGVALLQGSQLRFIK